jgi:hypothetical protein
MAFNPCFANGSPLAPESNLQGSRRRGSEGAPFVVEAPSSQANPGIMTEVK